MFHIFGDPGFAIFILPLPLILFSFSPPRVLAILGPKLRRWIAFPGAKRLFLLGGRNFKSKNLWMSLIGWNVVTYIWFLEVLNF